MQIFLLLELFWHPPTRSPSPAWLRQAVVEEFSGLTTISGSCRTARGQPGQDLRKLDAMMCKPHPRAYEKASPGLKVPWAKREFHFLVQYLRWKAIGPAALFCYSHEAVKLTITRGRHVPSAMLCVVLNGWWNGFLYVLSDSSLFKRVTETQSVVYGLQLDSARMSSEGSTSKNT